MDSLTIGTYIPTDEITIIELRSGKHTSGVIVTVYREESVIDSIIVLIKWLYKQLTRRM